MKRSIYGTILLSMLTSGLSAQVNTPNGVQVPPAALFTYANAGANTNAQLLSFQNDVKNGFYGASCIVLQDYTRQYNCHGYAWHVSTGGNQIAIDQIMFGGVAPYVSGVNPSYSQTSYNGSQGKLRIRYSGDHSAVTTYDLGKFISKWGAGPLVKHNAGDVPPGYGVPASYWTCKYAPPLTSVYLDVKLISGSFQNTNWGSHNMQIFWGLDPDTGPTFTSTAGSTIINNQNSGTVNFTFNGPSNNGGLSIAFCGVPRYSFTFFKPSGAKMQVYPNPVKPDDVLTISSGDENYIQAVSETSKIIKLCLFDGEQRLVAEYGVNATGSITPLKLKSGLKGAYFLKATFDDGATQTKQILIE